MAVNNAINLPEVVLKAYLSTNTGAVTGDGTLYTVVFDIKEIDNSDSYNASTGIFTVPVSGNYYIKYSINYLAQASGATYADTYIAYSGSASLFAYQSWPTINTCSNYYGLDSYISIAGGIVLPLAAAQTISVIVDGSGGSKLDIIAGAASSLYPTSLFIQKI